MGVSLSFATPVYCDYKSAIQIIHNDIFREQSKHIEINCHFVHHHLLQGSLLSHFTTFHDQLADLFTKSNLLGHFRDFVSKFKLVSCTPPYVLKGAVGLYVPSCTVICTARLADLHT
jgi:hypothetical protein